MGGVENVIRPDDIEVIKPNVHWYNQGVTNLSALMKFVNLIMDRPGGFSGEVELAENCRPGAIPWKSAGWATEFSRNSDLTGINNFNDPSSLLKRKYGHRYSTYHWYDIDAGGRGVNSPADGNGYVYHDGAGGIHCYRLIMAFRAMIFRL
jgi:hypothetical protein